MQSGYATFGNELLQTRGGPYISLKSFLKDQLVECQLRDRLLEPLVLPLQILELLCLIKLQPLLLRLQSVKLGKVPTLLRAQPPP